MIEDLSHLGSNSGIISLLMISDEQIRFVCAELVAERDPLRLDLLLAIAKNLCVEYMEQRSLFLTPSTASSTRNRARSGRALKSDKRAA
jgi:hypothetical protein